jgi:E3 ubiquitin-protein ligase CCNP1IP1
MANLPGNSVLGASVPQHRVSPRQPLASLNGNGPGPTGFAGYGMSAGLKVSNPTGSGGNGFARPAVRSRGRSAPGRPWVSY